MSVDFTKLLSQIRRDYVPADGYYRQEFVAREKAMLWPHTWLMACREELVANPGQFYTFDIADESILVVRGSDRAIRAFHNVCPHRGRRLKEGCGRTGNSIVCPFHGWSWDGRGRNTLVLNREDWDATGGLESDAVDLAEVRVGLWQGWVFVSFDGEIEPLEDYLHPLPEVFADFDYANTRLAWHKTVIVDCNWKVVLEAFLESYHVAATHPQTLKFGKRKPRSAGFGKHSQFAFPFAPPPETSRDGRPIDFRKARYSYIEEMNRTLGALWGRHALAAAGRLVDEVPETATHGEVEAAFKRFHAEAMAADGAVYPTALTPEAITRAGTAWNVFPNMVVLPTIDGWQGYRARPNGDDPNSAIFDAWWLERSAADAPSTVEPEFYPDSDSFKGQNYFLEQDFDNIRALQQGLRSGRVAGIRPNPEQEATILTFERTYYEHLVAPRGQIPA